MFVDSNGAQPTRTNLVEYPGFNKVSVSFEFLKRGWINQEVSG